MAHRHFDGRLPPWRSRRVITFAVIGLLVWLWYGRRPEASQGWSGWGVFRGSSGARGDEHPLPGLLRQANQQALSMNSARSPSLEKAFERYVFKYDRYPPLGFDKWVEAALEAEACNIDHFDELMSSLEIFWALSPEEIRYKQAQLADHLGLVRVRNGKVLKFGNEQPNPEQWGRVENAQRETLESLLMEVDGTFNVTDLPDVDMWVNGMDEPRVLLPWELKQELLDLAKKKQVRPFNDEKITVLDINWESEKRSAFEILTTACPPDSLSRRAVAAKSLASSLNPDKDYATSFTTPRGHFVANASAELDFCNQPDLHALAGFFIRPLNLPWIPQPFPVLSMTKVVGQNDILIPPWWYVWEIGYSPPHFHDFPHWRDEFDTPWERKLDKIFWRGTLNGGLFRGKNYLGWIRTRAVRALHRSQELKTTTNLLAMSGPQVPFSPPPPTIELKGIPVRAIAIENADVAVTKWDDFRDEAALAALKEDPLLKIGRGVGYDWAFRNKMLLDLDGTGYSGRFLTLQNSTSAVVKTHLFKEYLDDTLVPWYHYIPLSVRMREVYDLLSYFFGARNIILRVKNVLSSRDYKAAMASYGHDQQLEAIGRQGRDWVRRCARKEDMVLYAWRLALEWGRLTSDARDHMDYRLPDPPPLEDGDPQDTDGQEEKRARPVDEV